MPDIQVSNARRVVFTAMAVVVFWIVAWKAHAIAIEDVRATLEFRPIFHQFYAHNFEVASHSPYLAASMALIPIMFLSMSVANSPTHLMRDAWVLTSAAAIVSTILVACWLGMRLPPFTWEGEKTYTEMQAFRAALVARHHGSWPWLLLPLILTTAFVIYGAWRIGAKAAAQAEGENE